jgi:hypothetical protein
VEAKGLEPSDTLDCQRLPAGSEPFGEVRKVRMNWALSPGRFRVVQLGPTPWLQVWLQNDAPILTFLLPSHLKSDGIGLFGLSAAFGCRGEIGSHPARLGGTISEHATGREGLPSSPPPSWPQGRSAPLSWLRPDLIILRSQVRTLPGRFHCVRTG